MKNSEEEERDRKLLIVLSVIVLAGAFYFIASYFNFSLPRFGITPISCDRANFISTDAIYQNGSYFCSIAAQGAQSFELTLSPEEVNRLYGISTTKTVTVDGEITRQSCTYALSNVSKPVYEIGLDLHHLFCGGSGYYCGDPRTAPWIKIGSTGITGCNFAAYECTTCGAGKQPSSNSCDASYYKPIGRIYTIDQSSLQREFEFKITTTIDGKQYVNYITDKNSTFYNQILRGQYVGSFLGSSNCAPPSLDVFLDSQNSNAVSYVDKFLGDSVGSKSTTIISSHAQAISNGQTYNDEVNAMKSSAKVSPESFFGQYCQATTTADITRNTARVSCNPETPATIPVVNLYFNAAEIKILAPSGQPQIQEVKALTATAAQKLEVAITTKNIGDKATFDFAVSCDKINPQVFTVRATLDKNEIKTINVPTTYAGVSANCLAQVTSVNSPQIKDSKTVTLTFYPFCSLTNTNPAQSLVNTEFGCGYICTNYGEQDKDGNLIDVFDKSCQPITADKYDRCTSYNGTICLNTLSYSGIHCTGIGTYLPINKYLDQLYRKEISPFIPEKKSHQYFIVTINDKPVCNYVNEFAYKGGTNILVDSFDYNSQYPSATQGTAPDARTGQTNTPINLPGNTNSGQNQTTTQPGGIVTIGGLPDSILGINTGVVLILVVVIGGIVGIFYWRSQKGGK